MSIRQTTVELRVRYAECDPMNVAHHAAYPVWLEIARTELLRRQGVAYRDLEAQGIFFVVARMSIRYRRPARYDDLLQVDVEAVESAGVKVEHRYHIRRGDELLATAETTLVCVDRQGKPQRLPATVPPLA
jgi:acyl-CoA thioester hydrolase